MIKNKIVMIVEKTDTGFSAYSEIYPIFTTGRSIHELINNAYEGIKFYFEGEKVKVSRNDIKFKINFNHFFKI